MNIRKTGMVIVTTIILLIAGVWGVGQYLIDDKDTEFTRKLDALTVMKMTREEKAQAASEALLQTIPVGSKISEAVAFLKESGAECISPDEIGASLLKKRGRVFVCRMYRLHPNSTVTLDTTKEEITKLYNKSVKNKDHSFVLMGAFWVFSLSLSEDERTFTGVAYSKFDLDGL